MPLSIELEKNRLTLCQKIACGAKLYAQLTKQGKIFEFCPKSDEKWLISRLFGTFSQLEKCQKTPVFQTPGSERPVKDLWFWSNGDLLGAISKIGGFRPWNLKLGSNGDFLGAISKLSRFHTWDLLFWSNGDYLGPYPKYRDSKPKIRNFGQMAISWVLFPNYSDSIPETCDFGQMAIYWVLFQK